MNAPPHPTWFDWITVLALIAGPVSALYIQRWLDAYRDHKSRKLWIFKTLMSYRATRLNPLFVQALNVIDIEFTAKRERAIRDAWRELADHYADWGKKPPERRKLEDKGDILKSEDLLAELLVKMGDKLGYAFNKVYVKKSCYYPEGLGNIEQEQHALRGALLHLLSGQGAKLPVAVFTQDFQPIQIHPVIQGQAAEAPVPAQQLPPAGNG